MSGFLRLYPGDELFLFVANVLLQATVVILMAWILTGIAFRRNAAIRHNIWLSALILVLLCPALVGISNSVGLKVVAIRLPKNVEPSMEIVQPEVIEQKSNDIVKPASSALQDVTFDAGANKQLDFTSERVVAVSAIADGQDLHVPIIIPQTVNTFEWLRASGVVLIFAWGIGMFWFLLRLMRRGYAMHKLTSIATEITESQAIQHILNDVKRILGVDRLPRVLVWGDDNINITPITVGVFNPVVIVSQNTVGSLKSEELCDILVHEVAHVLRRDPMVGLLQRIAEIVFWPYLPVWIMNRKLALAREEVCDNYVLQHTDSGRYAQTLFDLSQHINPISPGLAQVGLFQYRWSLEQRVAGLLDGRRNVMTRINRLTMCVMSALFLGAVIIVSGTKLLQAEPPVATDKAQPAASADAASQVQRRTVNKLVKDFPEKTDLSTPESAWAAYQRATGAKDAKAILDLSCLRDSGPRALQETERFFKSNKDIEQYCQAVLDAEILEVAVYHDDVAQVISKLKFPEGVGRDPYSVRSFGRINGLWKNLGEDRLPNLESARESFEQKKDGLWQIFLDDKEILSGKKKPSSGMTVSPDTYALVKATTPDAEKLLLMGLVENFFVHNARDITARKSLEWGDVEKHEDGSRSIRYKFEARIWDKDTMVGNQIFTFDKDNVMISFKDVDGPPQKKDVKEIEKDGGLNTSNIIDLEKAYPELRKRSPDEIKIYKELESKTSATFKRTDELYHQGTVGGEAEKFWCAWVNAEIAKAELAWAEGSIADAYLHTYLAADAARWYLLATEAAYEMGKLSMQALGEVQTRLANTKLLLIRAEKVANAAGVDLTEAKKKAAKLRKDSSGESRAN